MINLILSLVAGLLVAILFKVTFLDSYWAMILPFFMGTIPVYIYLARRTGKELEALMEKVKIEMEPLQTPQLQTNEKLRFKQVERVVDVLKSGLELGRWQFLVASQLHAQIGQLYYTLGKFKKSRPHLEQAFSRAWMPRAMLACLYYKDKDYEKMKEVFEQVAKLKEAKGYSFFWNLYGWCVWKSDDADGAQTILKRGLDELKDDDRLQSNYNALRNGKKMKMRGWQEVWYQFRLEPLPKQKIRYDRRSMRGR